MLRAVDIHNAIQISIQRQHDYVDVTADRWPHLHSAFEMVSHDNGSGAGHARYSVPIEHEHLIQPAERGLTGLTYDQITVLAIGEQSEAEALVTNEDLKLAHHLLDMFFEDFNA